MKKGFWLIGLTGTNGAGKGEIAACLKSKGYACYSLSDEIREELARRDREATRDNMIKLGNELRQTFGTDILARRVMAKVRGKAVIDSIRNVQEVAFFRKQKGFILLAVDAPIALRYDRVRMRGRDESALTLAEFEAKEREEMSESPNGQQLRRCLDLADITIGNDGTLEDLRRKLEELL